VGGEGVPNRRLRHWSLWFHFYILCDVGTVFSSFPKCIPSFIS
jgi:hypothetical protein